MAGVSGSPKPSRTCQGLLEKLKQGQDVLRRSIKGIKPPVELAAASRQILGQRKLESLSRDSLTIALDRTSKLPRKRARLQQLSPGYETSPARPHKKHPRRLSSTPMKTTSTNQLQDTRPRWCAPSPPPPSPNVDVSLEEALFDKENMETTSHSRPGNLPSPKLSKIEVDTSRSIGGIKPVSSALRKVGQEKKSKRGLTVSFVQHDKAADPSKSKFSRHATQRNMDSSLISSLNSSRHGAMEQRYSQARREQVQRSPGGYPGADPRLGYDWIAGLLDASESYLSEKDDEYFRGIEEFRRVNYDECHRPNEVLLPISASECPKVEEAKEERKRKGLEEDLDMKATCVRSYMLNDRLFPMPASSLHHAPGKVCPACEDKPKKVPSSTSTDRYIRVSVPHSVLQAPAKFRPHRRRSFDPTDSMGLAKHCLIGWENAKPSMVPPQPPVDLKSSMPKGHHQAQEADVWNTETGQNLLDTSHSIEYNLRSRAHVKDAL